jgi:hypothetical protein
VAFPLGKIDDERLNLLVGQQIVDDDRRPRPLGPFSAGVAQAVMEIEHRILSISTVVGGSVDPEQPAQAECLGVVFDDAHLAMRNALAGNIEALRRRRVSVQVLRFRERRV